MKAFQVFQNDGSDGSGGGGTGDQQQNNSGGNQDAAHWQAEAKKAFDARQRAKADASKVLEKAAAKARSANRFPAITRIVASRTAARTTGMSPAITASYVGPACSEACSLGLLVHGPKGRG